MKTMRRYLHGSFAGHTYLLDDGTLLETVLNHPAHKWPPTLTRAGRMSGTRSRAEAAAILRAARSNNVR